jgi:hypothetical protein
MTSPEKKPNKRGRKRKPNRNASASSGEETASEKETSSEVCTTTMKNRQFLFISENVRKCHTDCYYRPAFEISKLKSCMYVVLVDACQ